MKQHLIRLKTLLHCNYFYIGLFIFLIIYVFLRLYFSNNVSVYDLDTSYFEMVITEYKFDGNKLTLELNGKEKLIGNYYIDDFEEYLSLKDSVKYGLKVELFGTLNEPSDNTIPNTFNYRQYLNNNDIYYTLSIDSISIVDDGVGFIYTLKNLINDRINEIDCSGYMKAFILGDKNEIDSEVYEKFQKIGITHLFALSGMHVGLLSGIILKFIKKLSEGKKYFIISFILVIYGFIVGYPASIKRCILFFIFNSLNKFLKLEITSFKILLLVIVILVLHNYKVIYDVGFLYSIVTVGGIIICNEFISCDNKVVSSFRLSLVAFLFSLPISLCNFYEVNLLSVFYNIIFVPFVSGIVYPLSLLCFIFPFLNGIFVFMIDILESSSSFLGNVDFLCVCMNFNFFEVIMFYFILIVMFYKSDFRLLIVLLFIIVVDLFLPYFDSNYYVYFFDVGQGDSGLIVTPYRRDVVLIDTGGVLRYSKEEWMETTPYYVSDNVISFMKSIGIKKLDSLIISHGDYDHMGDAINLVENLKINKVIFNCGSYNDLELGLIEVLDNNKIPYYSCIKEFNIDDNKLYFLNNKYYDNENDNSSVVYAKLNNYKFLFMGDAGIDVEDDLIENYNLHDIDVLKVGHHGSKTSSSKKFINEIAPKYSVISVGENNRYGHPNDDILNNLERSKIYRTDQDGSIMFKIKKDKTKIETCSPQKIK